jgi:hypothetical protein
MPRWWDGNCQQEEKKEAEDMEGEVEEVEEEEEEVEEDEVEEGEPDAKVHTLHHLCSNSPTNSNLLLGAPLKNSSEEEIASRSNAGRERSLLTIPLKCRCVALVKIVA